MFHGDVAERGLRRTAIERGPVRGRNLVGLAVFERRAFSETIACSVTDRDRRLVANRRRIAGTEDPHEPIAVVEIEDASAERSPRLDDVASRALLARPPARFAGHPRERLSERRTS